MFDVEKYLPFYVIQKANMLTTMAKSLEQALSQKITTDNHDVQSTK